MAAILAGGAFVAGALLLATLWGIAAPRDDQRQLVGSGTPVGVPGGEVRVDAVRPEVMNHDMAPGMQMVDEVPEGYRRFAIDLTIMAAEDMQVSPAMFRVAAGDLPPAGPHRSALRPMRLPAGQAVSATLVFDAPKDADGLRLEVDGGDAAVVLDGSLGDGDGHHPEDGHSHSH